MALSPGDKAPAFTLLDQRGEQRGDQRGGPDVVSGGAPQDLLGAIERGEPVHGVVFSGRRYDTGDKLDYLKAVIRLAVERDDLGPALRTWLHEFVTELPAEGASSS